jgi:hypothetical protein
MQWDFRLAIQDLHNMGLLDVLLPFFLIFTVVFAILQRSNILGQPDEARKYNVIVALVIGFLVIIPHVLYNPYSSGPYLNIAGTQLPDVVFIINNAIPSISIWIIGVLMVMILLGLFGKEINLWIAPLSTMIFIAAVAIVFYTFAVAANWLQAPYWLNFLNDRGNQSVILILLIFGIVIWFVVGKPGGGAVPREGFFKKLGEAIQSAVGPGAGRP